MTYASRSHEALEEIDALRALRCQVANVLEKIDEVAAREAERAKIREAEEAEMHAKIAVANAIRVLTKLRLQSRVSDGDRQQISGVICQLERME